MQKKLIGLIFLSLFFSNVYASYAQNVKLCLDVQTNTGPFNFQAGFVSTDAFDRAKNTPTLYRGKECVSHKYNHGPKNLLTTVKAYKATADVLINPDSSCRGFYNTEAGNVSAGYQSSRDSEQTWEFTLNQAKAMGAFDYVYDLHCQHTGN